MVTSGEAAWVSILTLAKRLPTPQDGVRFFADLPGPIPSEHTRNFGGSNPSPATEDNSTVHSNPNTVIVHHGGMAKWKRQQNQTLSNSQPALSLGSRY
jgi:hypothetical protein